MTNSPNTLNSLYPDATLAHLRETSLSAFHTLVYQASKVNDFEFARRALAQAGAADAMTTKDNNSSYLKYYDGADTYVSVQNEMLYRSFLSQLRSRPFTSAEKEYLEAALAQSISADRKKLATERDATPAEHATTAYFVHAAADKAPVDLLLYLIAKDVKPHLCKLSNFQINGSYVAVSPLGAAVLIDSPQVFTSLLGKLAKLDQQAVKDIIMAGHLTVARSAYSEEKRSLLEALALFAAPENFANYLDQVHRIMPVTDDLVDHMLCHHLARESRGKSGDRIEVRKEWRRNLSFEGWDSLVVEALISRRSSATAPPTELVRLAIGKACTPVIAAVAQTPGFNVHGAYATNAARFSTPIHSLTYAQCGPEELRTCVHLLIACGADINAQDHDGYTPLILAAANAKLDVMGVLLDAGADPEIKDKRNWRALSHLKDPQHKRRFEQMISSLKAKQKIASVVDVARGYNLS